MNDEVVLRWCAGIMFGCILTMCVALTIKGVPLLFW